MPLAKTIIPIYVGKKVLNRVRNYAYEIGTENISTAIEILLQSYLSDPIVAPDSELPPIFSEESMKTSICVSPDMNRAVHSYAESHNSSSSKIIKTALNQGLYFFN